MKRPVQTMLSGIVALSCVAFLGGRVSADTITTESGPPDPSYSSFGAVTIVSGAILNINGVPATNNAINNNTNGTYTFGFLSASTPIVVSFSGANSNFGIGAGGGTDSLTAFDAVYLVHNGPSDGKDSITATVATAPITAYNGSNSPPDWTGGPAPGADFPSYWAGNFGSANFLREGSGTDPQSGDFSFTNIALGAGATGVTYFGVHARDAAGNTGFLILEVGAGPSPGPTPGPTVPVPPTLLLGSLGAGLWFLPFGVRRLRRGAGPLAAAF